MEQYIIKGLVKIYNTVCMRSLSVQRSCINLIKICSPVQER